jgi:hypothetical protein
MLRNLLVILAFLIAARAHAGDAPPIAFAEKEGRVDISVGGAPMASYVWRDDKISRPYFAHLRAPGGIQVTRNHPPTGKDPNDHAEFHPGLWLAFGDLSGADNWRLKAPVKHVEFVDKPRGVPGRGRFAVKNQYFANDGKKLLCTETARYTFVVRPSGHLLVWESTLATEQPELVFGDQEEMGLGVRVATALIVKNGGTIHASTGETNEKRVRGKAAPWCDYGGVIDGKRVGVTLMIDPKNFRPSWYHARDYGLLVANPFGRNALTGGKTSRVVVKRGEPLVLRFGVLLHASNDARFDGDAEYREFLKDLGK